MNRSSKIAGLAYVALAACICWAQTQVNSQVNTRVAGTGTDSTIRYSHQPTSRMMPSEIRYAYWKSGLLPGEVRSNYLRLGPMTPRGQSAYFDKPDTGSSAPNQVQDTRVDTLARPYIPPAPDSNLSAGSIRYSNAANSSKVASSHVSNQSVGSVKFDSKFWH